MKTSTPTIVATIVLIGAGGFIAGRLSSSRSGSENADDGTAAAPRVSSRERVGMSPRLERGGRDASERAVSELPASLAQRKVRLEEIVRSEDPLSRSRAMLDFIDQLGAGEFEDAVAHFRSLGLTEERMGEYGMLLSAWARIDPIAALAYTDENTRGRFATNTVLTTWAANDAEGAIRWADSKHTEDGANPYYAGIIRALSESDPALAESMLTGMPRSVERGEALEAMLPSVLARGGAEAREWINSLTDDSLRNGAMLRSARQLAEEDPAATATWLLENPGEASQRRLDDAYSAWAEQDEAGALAALQQLEAGDTRSNALRGVVSTLADEDPQAAVSLMDQFPNDVNDRVVRSFIWQSFGTDPSVAVGQIARLEDEGYRSRMYERAVPRWHERDPEAASQWINSNSLPENLTEKINRRIADERGR